MPKAKYSTETIKGDNYYVHYEPTGKYDANSKPEYKKFRAKTIKKMDEKLDAYRSQSLSGIVPSNITVDKWFGQYMQAYKASALSRTQDNYRYLYAHIQLVIGNKSISKVTAKDCQQIITNISNNKSVSTVQAVAKLLRSMFRAAYDNELVVKNPTSNITIKGKGNEKKIRRALTNDERKKYLNACSEHPFGLFASFLYWFGLRRGECVALLGSDVNKEEIKINKQYVYPDNNKPQLDTTKTFSGIRTVPIPDEARRYIDFGNLPDGNIFTGTNGPMSLHELTRRWNSFIKYALGADTDITMHYVRHNYCCLLFEAGLQPLEAKEIMGHSDIETTLKIYAHYTEQMNNAASKKIKSLGTPPNDKTSKNEAEKEIC